MFTSDFFLLDILFDQIICELSKGVFTSERRMFSMLSKNGRTITKKEALSSDQILH